MCPNAKQGTRERRTPIQRRSDKKTVKLITILSAKRQEKKKIKKKFN